MSTGYYSDLEKLKIIKSIKRNKLTVKQAAARFGVSERVINKWIKNYDKFGKLFFEKQRELPFEVEVIRLSSKGL